MARLEKKNGAFSVHAASSVIITVVGLAHMDGIILHSTFSAHPPLFSNALMFPIQGCTSVKVHTCILPHTHIPMHMLSQVQSKVNLKYDSWHREIVSKFGALLGQNMQEFHTTIGKARL